jgi:hypothetical protein
MAIGIQKKPTISSTKPASTGSVKPKPHQAMANALAQTLGGKVHKDLPGIPEGATSKQLTALLKPAWEQMGGGAKPVLAQDEAVWLLKLAAHPNADQGVHDAIANHVVLSPPMTAKVADSGFSDFLVGLSPTVKAEVAKAEKAAKTAEAKEGKQASASEKKTVGTKESAGAMQTGAGPAKAGNVLSSKIALMTGEKSVKSTSAGLAELKKALSEGRVPTSLPMAALDKLGIDKPGGLTLRLDGSKLAGQRVVIRKVDHPKHGPGLEFQFKLRTGEDIRGLDEKLKAAGGQSTDLKKEKMAVDKDGTYKIDDKEPFTVKTGWSETAQATTLADAGRFSVEVVDDQQAQALRGSVRLRVFGEGAELNAAMSDAVAKAGLGPVFEDSSTTTQARANQMRALWQRDPKKAQEFAQVDVATIPQAKLDAALKAAGIDPVKTAALKSKEVFPGHFTTVNPAQVAEYKKLGVEYLFAGVGTAESVARILGGDGLMSTLERYDRGIIVDGASSAEDIKTGGADYVFTRMVTDAAKETSLTSPFAAGKFQIQIDTRVLERTDWFAYASDTYGNTKDASFTDRKYGKELVDSLETKNSWNNSTTFATDNEVMFQRGISKEYFSGILTQSAEAKKELIAELKKVGVTEIGGKPLSVAITVQQKMIE